MPLKAIQRRTFIGNARLGAVGVPVTVLLARTAQADDDFPTLKEDDPTAIAIAYVSDASRVDAKALPMYRPGQDCSNCGLYDGDKGAPKGTCQLVLGQYVLARAWCKSWEARPEK